MSIKDSNLDQRILFWAVLGPSVLLAAFFVALVKATFFSVAISLLGVCALPLCLKWRMRGLYLVLGVLSALICVVEAPAGQRVWQLGFAATLALSFVVIALSFEEVRGMVEHILAESKSRLENLWRLDEKLRCVQERWAYEREDLSVRNKLLSEEVKALKAQVEKQDITLAFSKRTIEELDGVRVRFAQELMRERQLSEGLERQLARFDQEMRGVVSSDGDTGESQEMERELRKAKGQYVQLRDQFEEKNRTLHETRVDLFQREGELHLLRQQVDELKAGELCRREKEWEGMLGRLATENKAKEEEVAALNTLVSELFEELSQSAS